MLEQGKVVKEMDLVANSKKKARYLVRLFELPGAAGYVIAKLSGATGSTPVSESWYRADLEAAIRKFDGIVRKKTNRTSGRIYTVAPQPAGHQMLLF